MDVFSNSNTLWSYYIESFDQKDTTTCWIVSFIVPSVCNETRSFTVIFSTAAGSKINQEKRNSSLFMSMIELKGIVIDVCSICYIKGENERYIARKSDINRLVLILEMKKCDLVQINDPSVHSSHYAYNRPIGWSYTNNRSFLMLRRIFSLNSSLLFCVWFFNGMQRKIDFARSRQFPWTIIPHTLHL